MKFSTLKHARQIVRYLGKALFLLACLLDKSPYYKSLKKVQLHPQTNIRYLPDSIDQKTRTEFFYRGHEKRSNYWLIDQRNLMANRN